MSRIEAEDAGCRGAVTASFPAYRTRPRQPVLLSHGDFRFLEMSRCAIQKADCAVWKLWFSASVPEVATGRRQRDVSLVRG